MSKFFSQYQPKSNKDKKEIEVRHGNAITGDPTPIDKEEIIKPDIISRYVQDAMGVVDSEIPVRTIEKKKENPLQKKSSVTTPTKVNPPNDAITQLIEKQLNITKEVIIQRQQEKSNPLQKKSTIKAIEPGLEGVEYEEYPNPRFMRELSRHELKHKNHSSIIIAKECFLKYFYKCVVNMVPEGEKVIFLPWGSAYHLFRQRLSEYYGYGENTPVKFDSEKAKEAFKKASREGMAYWHKNGEDQKPDSKYEWYTAERLYLSFLKAFEWWTLERKQGKIKVLAVEQYFVIELMDGSYVQGRVDEALDVQGELWGRDFKTTQKPRDWFEKTMNPNNQVKTYSFGNGKLANRECKGLLVESMYNAKSTKQGPKGPEVFPFTVETTKIELEQWEKEQAHWNKLLKICREDDVWPQSEVACQYCEYQQVCTKPTEASKIYTLQNKYVKFLRNPAIVD